VAGNVDKTFFDYIIIAKTNARQRRFALIHFTLFQGIQNEETRASYYNAV
jgi:hypothetical protein